MGPKTLNPSPSRDFFGCGVQVASEGFNVAVPSPQQSLTEGNVSTTTSPRKAEVGSRLTLAQPMGG